MIHEFAIEPEALSEFNFVWQALEQFGVEHGRMISEFPKGWRRQVYAATAKCRGIERSRLEVRLRQLKRKVVRFRQNRPSDASLSWRQNTHTEDLEEPFRAIIQSDNNEKHERVLTPFELHDESPLWRVKTQVKVERTPESLASVLGPLGRVSKQLLFVDPHFSTEVRWSKVFLACLNAVGTFSGSHSRIEVHTGSSPPLNVLEANVKQWIAPRLPAGLQVTFVLWDQRDSGEKMHARYFLTERGGIRFDVGLDEGQPGESTDVGLLSKELYEARWADFQNSTAAYEKVGEFKVSR